MTPVSLPGEPVVDAALARAHGLTVRRACRYRAMAWADPILHRAWGVLGNVVGTLFLQILPQVSENATDERPSRGRGPRRECGCA